MWPVFDIVSLNVHLISMFYFCVLVKFASHYGIAHYVSILIIGMYLFCAHVR